MDLLEAEVQNYDILVFTETWLSPQISNDDLLLENFDPPYRQDRHARVGGGVAIYIASGIPSCKRNDIIQGDIEGIWIEVSIQSHRFLLCGMYRPPNSGSYYWDLIEQTFDNLCDSHITDLVILGDFNSDLLKPMHANRIQNLTNSYNLHQLIDEPTHYTENSSSLLDLTIVSKPENVVFSGVSSPFIPDLIRYHCPIIVTLKFRKPIQTPFKRHIWLYDKGGYNKYKRLLSENDWSFISAANNVDEIADKVSSIINEAAKQSIPFKEITVRPNEPPWINSNIKRRIRQRKRLFKRAKKSNNEHIWTQY